jgi:hypothetical protein
LRRHRRGFQEAAKLGAFLEFNSAAVVREFSTARAMVQAIRKVGPASVVVGTDCGQMNNPHPADCMGLMAKALSAQGLTERELNLMFKENPAKLLGLEPPSSQPPQSAGTAGAPADLAAGW